jgi:hypothetical protein
MSKDVQLIVVDPKEYGLGASEAKQVEAVFTPMIEKMKDLEDDFNAVTDLPMDPATCKKAQILRMKYVKIRTATAEIHKTAKAYYRAGGLFVDAWKNAQAFAAGEKEAVLAKIEKHYELIEQEKTEKLTAERQEALAPYVVDTSFFDLAGMSQAGFDQLLSSSKLAFEAQKKAEEDAEAARVADEKRKAEEAEVERIKNVKRDAELAELKQKEADAEAERLATEAQEAEQKKADDRLKKAKEYKAWLVANGYTEETKHLYLIETNAEKSRVQLFRLVDTFEVK